MQCLLRDFLPKLQRVIHANFHRRVGPACDGAFLEFSGASAGMPVSELVRTWASTFRTEFTRRHDVIDITKALIISRLAAPRRTPELARAVGMSARALERRFREKANQTIVEFRTIERVKALDRELRNGVKFGAAAKTVGWSSPKDAYRACKRDRSGCRTSEKPGIVLA